MKNELFLSGRTVRQIQMPINPATENGFSLCGLCRICTCLRWGFLSTPPGVVKSSEVLLSFVCQFLSLYFGVKYSADLGIAFIVFLNASAASFVTSFILLICYLASPSTFFRVRPTYFEIFFNLSMCVMFLGSGSSLVYSVHKNLFYYFNTIPGFHAYPAMTANYMFGFMLAVLHGLDSVMCFRTMRSLK